MGMDRAGAAGNWCLGWQVQWRGRLQPFKAHGRQRVSRYLGACVRQGRNVTGEGPSGREGMVFFRECGGWREAVTQGATEVAECLSGVGISEGVCGAGKAGVSQAVEDRGRLVSLGTQGRGQKWGEEALVMLKALSTAY